MAGRLLIRTVLNNLLLAGLFFATGRLGLSLGFAQLNVTPIWPPSGLALFAIWLGGPRLLPGVFVGGSLTTLSTGAPFTTALIAGLGNVAEAYAGFLFLRAVAFNHSLEHLRDVLLLLLAAAVTPIVGATFGVAALWLNNLILDPQWLNFAVLWWMGDAVGLYLVAPFLFSWRKPRLPRNAWRLAELCLLIVGMFVVSSVIFSQTHGGAYSFFPFLIWGALRFFQPGATLAVLVLSVLTIGYTTSGFGPFAFGDSFRQATQIQLFTAVAAVTGYVLAAGAWERRRNEAIRLKNAALEAARHEAESGRQRFAFLAEVSRVLSQSLEYETTLRNVVRLAVPRLADYAVAAIAFEDGTLRYVEVYHPVALEQEKLRYRNEKTHKVDAAHPIMRAALTKQVLLTSRLEGDPGNDEDHLVVPLASEEGIGLVICWALSGSGRKYTPADIALAEEVRTRANIAVENARLYQDAQKAVALRNEFLSVAAHELKTPVTGLLGFTQFARRQLDLSPPDHAKVAMALQSVESQTKKLSLLISQLLDVARIESGKLALEPELIDVRPFVEGILNQMSAQLGDRPVTIVGPNAQVFGDALRLEQVLVNLMSNAIKFTPPQSAIEIEVFDGLSVAVAVRDHGPGIPAAELPYVFDRFFQGEAGAAQGMGLGLYISQQIALMHGGTLSADSPSDGGCRFTLSLPASGQGAS